MFKRKIVDTIEDMSCGELLSEKDFFEISDITFSKIPLTTYKLEVYNYFHKEWDRYVEVDEPLITTEIVNSTLEVYVPILRGCYIKELAIKWYHPQLYLDRAKYYRVAEDGSTRSMPQFRFKRTVMLYVRAAELYEQLVLELLPLFKEADRETAKFRMLAGTVGMCAQLIATELSPGIREDIKYQKEKFGIKDIPQKTIDMWIEYSNIADAWVTLGNNYKRSKEIYSYNAYQEALKAGKNDPCPPQHPDKTPRGLWYIYPPSHHIKKFIKERQLALNPQLEQHEVISVKINPIAIMFTYGVQKTSMLASRVCIPSAYKDSCECISLLDQLDGYNSKYIAPKVLTANSIDKEIMLSEKNVIQAAEHTNATDIKELLQVTYDGIRLLSLAHMRYKISLDSKEESAYFSWFKPASAVDKDNYYELFSFYMRSIFQKCLVPLLKLTTKSPNIYESELKRAIEATNSLLVFSHSISSIESKLAKMAVKTLDDMQNLCGRENIITGKNVAGSGLRQRHLVKV